LKSSVFHHNKSLISAAAYSDTVGIRITETDVLKETFFLFKFNATIFVVVAVVFEFDEK
jgi:hypothetical protein